MLKWMKMGKLGIFVTALFTYVSLGTCIARADSVTYSFTGADSFAGDDFTYVSPSGFLTLSSTNYTPTTSTNVLGFLFATDGPYEFLGIGTPSASVGLEVSGLDPTMTGTETLRFVSTGESQGQLVITETTAVPEIDPRATMAPFALIASAVMIFRGRRKTTSALEP